MNGPKAVGFETGIVWRRLRAVGDDDLGGEGLPAKYRVYIPAHPDAPATIDDVDGSLTPDFPAGPHQLWHEAAMLTAIMERRFAVDEGRNCSLLLGPYRHYYINDLFLRMYYPDPTGGGGGGGGGDDTWTLDFPAVIDGDSPPWLWDWDSMLEFPAYLADREEYWRYLTGKWIGDLGADSTLWMRPDEDPPTIEPPNIGARLLSEHLPMFNDIDWEEHSSSVRDLLLPKRVRPASWDVAEYEEDTVTDLAVEHPMAVPRRFRGNILGWLTRALFNDRPDFCAGSYAELDEENPNYDPDYEGPFHLYQGSHQHTYSVTEDTSALDTTAKRVARVKEIIAARGSWPASTVTTAFWNANNSTPTTTGSRLLADARCSCTWSIRSNGIDITFTASVSFTRHRSSSHSPDHAYINVGEKTGGIRFSTAYAYRDVTASMSLKYSDGLEGWSYFDAGTTVTDPDLDEKKQNFATALRAALPLAKEPTDVTPGAAEIRANGPFVVDVMSARPNLSFGQNGALSAFLNAVSEAARTSWAAYASCRWENYVYLTCDMDFRTFMRGSDLPVVWGRENMETDDAGVETSVDRRVHTPSWGGPDAGGSEEQE